MTDQRVRPVMLVVLDGWGWREEAADNAVRQARTPTFDRLWAGPHAFLRTSGGDVGLPDGQMGNSEVGHITLGSGCVIRQDLVLIDDAIADALSRHEPCLLDVVTNPDEISLPPKATVHEAWGFAIAKAKENLTSRT